MKSSLPVLSLGCLLVSACSGDDPAPTPPVGLTLLPYYIAVDVSPDGTRAVFERFDEETSEVSFVVYDTVAGAVIDEAVVGDPTRVLATGVSDDGAVSAMHGDPVVAGVWRDGAWTDIPSPYGDGCDTATGAAWDVSGDGAAAAGMVWHGCAGEAFRWDGGEMVVLEVLGELDGGTPTNRGTLISDDGVVVAGFAQRTPIDRTAARWDGDGGELLFPDELDSPSEVLAIDADGSTLAGTFGAEGFVWTAGGVTMLPRTPDALPSDPVFPNAITADGTRVFGGVGDAFFGLPVAFEWTEAGGTVALADSVDDLPEGVVLQSVLGASADGKVLIGTSLDAQGVGGTFLLVRE